jgi:hypothetical protein
MTPVTIEMKMPIEPFMPDATPWLPGPLIRWNLLTGFIVYVTFIFVVSTLLRIRFYHSVYRIALYVKQKCPNVFALLENNWSECVEDGVVVRTIFYLAVLAPYLIFTRVVFPSASLNVVDFAERAPLLFVCMLGLFGLMAGIDLFLLVQVTVVDVPRIVADLELAERWLGGRINRLFERMLGTWNPINRYAQAQTRQTLTWFNGIFRSSMSIMILQVGLRLAVGACLLIGCRIVQSTAAN